MNGTGQHSGTRAPGWMTAAAVAAAVAIAAAMAAPRATVAGERRADDLTFSDASGVQRAFSLLVSKGVIRIGLDVPAQAEFEIVDADDPYRCGALFTSASVYRRPLPTTNLAFLSTVMWDGRETVPGQAVRENLITQALHATTGHAQGAPPSRAHLEEIVDFELGLFTAQAADRGAGSLTANGGRGGP